jgi:hypothetical protein
MTESKQNSTRRKALKTITGSLASLGLVGSAGSAAADLSNPNWEQLEVGYKGDFGADWDSVRIAVVGGSGPTESNLREQYSYVKDMMGHVINTRGYLDGARFTAIKGDPDIQTHAECREALIDTDYQSWVALLVTEWEDTGTLKDSCSDGFPSVYKPYRDNYIDEKTDIPVSRTNTQKADHPFLAGLHELQHSLIRWDIPSNRDLVDTSMSQPAHSLGHVVKEDCGFSCTNYYKTPMAFIGLGHQKAGSEGCSSDVNADGLTWKSSRCEAEAMENTANWAENNC